MKKPILLKQFEYAIIPSAIALTGSKKNTVAEHLPLMKVVIDFQHGNLKLEGDRYFMMSSNKYNEADSFDYHMERVEIETAICASSAIDMDDSGSDGLIFPLNGSIKDENSLFSCSGLLELDNVRGINGLISDQWNISLYLYDLQFYGCEIKFKLPVFMASSNKNNN
jgi:hypothetical protein